MEKPQWAKIDRQLVHDVAVGPQPGIQLVAKASGWQIGGKGASPNFTGALVKVQPVAVRFQDGDRQATVPLDDPTRTGILAISGVALLISVICWIIRAVATRQIAHGQSSK